MCSFIYCCPTLMRDDVAEWSGAMDSSSVVYRMWAWSVVTLVSLGKALYHNCFSPPSNTKGNGESWDGLASCPRRVEVLKVV